MTNTFFKLASVTVVLTSISACSSDLINLSSNETPRATPYRGTTTYVAQNNTTTMNRLATNARQNEALPQEPVAGSNASLASNINISMDNIDKSKLFHALDNPIGKSTSWTNGNTNTNYTVVPTAKVTINQNPYCRKYSVRAVRADKTRQITGTACVGADGTWEAV